MYPQKDMPDLRIEPPPPAPQSNADATALDRRRDQDLCVLAKNSLIWICTVFYAYTWPFKIIDNVVYYTPPQISGGVLCFHVGCPCVCPSVRP